MKTIIEIRCRNCGYEGVTTASEDGHSNCPGCGQTVKKALADFSNLGRWLILFAIGAVILLSTVYPGSALLPILLVVGLIVYFVPTAIALRRDHRNLIALAALNVFAGWTLLGWVGALVWSLYQEKK